ncbi:MAG: hypothetical protein ACXVHM_03085 [Methanobacterium sp.]
MKKTITWQLPLKIANEANSNEHWAVKSRRHKHQKARIKSEFLKDNPEITIPCTCILTRIAPRKLDDHDNLRVSMKWVVDAIAAELTGNHVPGRADDNSGIIWEYKQEKGKVREYGLRVEIIKES